MLPGFVLLEQDRTAPPTIAIDFDGTLATYDGNVKKLGKVIDKMRKRMRGYQDAGYRIIIWTCRGDEKKLKDWLHDNDVPYDYINHNPDQPSDASDKIMADLYWDDRAVNPNEPNADKRADKLISKAKR